MSNVIVYPLKIDSELWERFKESFPRSMTPTRVLTGMIEDMIEEENESKGGK